MDGLAGLDIGRMGAAAKSIARSHVEGRAAAIMRRDGITRATVYVDREICDGCRAHLAKLLPAGTELTVRWRKTNGEPDHFVARGTGEAIKR